MGLSLPLRHLKEEHDDNSACQMKKKKDKALQAHTRYVYKRGKELIIDVALQALPRLIPWLGSTDAAKALNCTKNRNKP